MNIVFIVGVGRSGTSLLHSMVGANPDIVALPETSFLRRYAFQYYLPGLNYQTDEKFDRFPELKAALRNREPTYTPSELLDTYREAAAEKSSQIIVDKDPRLVEYIDLLVSSFPGCKIIHIYRDPRDVLLSKKTAKWSKGRPLLSYLLASRIQINDATHAEDKHGILSIKYETLVSNPAPILKGICDYIGVSYSDSMLKHTELARKLMSEDEASWKKKTLQPVSEDNIGKWKSQLSNVEALASELVIGKQFNGKSAYTRQLSAISIPQVAASHALKWIVAIGTWIYTIKRKSTRSRHFR